MEKQLVERKHRLVLVPHSFEGHLNPMLQLAKALHSNGFSITIAHTVFNSPKSQASHPEFSFVPLPDGLQDPPAGLIDPVSITLTINENCKEMFKAFLRRVIEEGEVVSCVISDEFMFFAEDVANELRVPTAILRTTSAAASLARSALVSLYDQALLSKDSPSDDIVPNLDPLRYKDLPFSLTHNFEKYSVLMSRIYGDRKSSATIWNTANCLEQSILEKIRIQFRVPLFPIGPVHLTGPSISSSLLEEDSGCLSWLDKQPPGSVIYLSCSGSFASITGKEATEIALGLARSQQRFLWVIRPGSVDESGWIESLPEEFRSAVGERGCIVKWAPQKAVLAHKAVAGFWSHCGWNSVLESLAEGVPLICRPCFSDQRVNSRYVTHVWWVGLELEEPDRGAVERAVRGLISGQEGQEIRARAEALRDEIRASMRKGGSSRDSFDELVSFLLSQESQEKKKEENNGYENVK